VGKFLLWGREGRGGRHEGCGKGKTVHGKEKRRVGRVLGKGGGPEGGEPVPVKGRGLEGGETVSVKGGGPEGGEPVRGKPVNGGNGNGGKLGRPVTGGNGNGK